MIEFLEPRRLLTAIVINSTDDAFFPIESGIMTLRMATSIANQNSDPTTITFDPSLASQTILEHGTGLLIGGSQPITIIGPADGPVAVDGNSIGSIVTVNGNVSISNMNFVNGAAPAFYNLGISTLNLNNVNIQSNFGLIQNFGTVYYAEPLATVLTDLQDGDIGWNGPNGMANGYLDLGNTIELKYTLLGDTNLDGTVDFTDFMHMTQHFTQTGVGWAQGDFNYDGIVNDADFQLLKPNYGLTDPPGTGLSAMPQNDLIQTGDIPPAKLKVIRQQLRNTVSMGTVKTYVGGKLVKIESVTVKDFQRHVRGYDA